MTAQVTATPPGTSTLYQSGARIPAEPGVVYTIADVNANGAVGPVLNPLALPRDAVGDDLQITLPDGTVLIFDGMMTVLAQGAGGGLAGPDGAVAIASIEAAVAPAAGPEPGPTDSDGSSSAFNQFVPIDQRVFGEAPEGPFIGLGLPEFAVREEDENILLVQEEELVEVPPPGPRAQNDTVITADDGRIIVLARALLANDSGTDLKIVSVQDYTGPGGDASVSLDPNGNIIIDPVTANPALDNSGQTQTLTYTVEDASGNQSTATVLVYVDEVRFVDGFIGQPPGPPPGDLGNGNSEIFIPLDPSPQQDQPPGVQTFVGGPGDDFFQVRDEQNIDVFGGPGFDTLLADAEYSSFVMDFDLPNVFSQANNSIERIQPADEVSGGGIVRLSAQSFSTAVDWDFSDVELIDIDEIRASNRSDSIVGSDADDTILAFAGNDRIDGGPGDDFIDLQANDFNNERVIISDRDDGIDTIANFDNFGSNHDTLDLDALFDDLEVDIELGPGGLSATDRAARVSVVQNGADTDVFIDASAAGDGSALVQIATILDTNAGFFEINTGNEDIFVGA